MPWVSGDDYEQMQAHARDRELEIAELQRRLALAEATGRVATAVTVELESLTASGQILEVAEPMAVAAVVASERSVLVAETAQRLLASDREQYAHEFRTEYGAEVHDEVDADLSQPGGGYEQQRALVRQEERDKIRAVLLGVAGEKERAELVSGPGRTALVAEVRTEMAESRVIQEYRQSVRRQFAEEWQQQVEESLKAEIDAEETAREDEFKQAYRERRLQERDMVSYRARKRQELEQKWAGVTEAAIMEAVDDEELGQLLSEQVAIRKAKLQRENRAEQLLADFESQGLDTATLAAGDILIVYFGEVVEETKAEYRYDPSYGSHRTVNDTVRGVVYGRKVQFEAVGGQEGLFNVRFDSASDAGNDYERRAALRAGTQVKLGRKLIVAGMPKLDTHITGQTLAVYDIDPDTPDTFDDIPVPVVTVTLNDVEPHVYDFIRAKEVAAAA